MFAVDETKEFVVIKCTCNSCMYLNVLYKNVVKYVNYVKLSSA